MRYPRIADFLMELFATFLLVIIIGMTYANTSFLVVGLAVGLGVALLAASEGADMNPVISIAMALTDRYMGWADLFAKVIAQLIGSILGGLVAVASWRREKLNFDERTTSTATKALVFEIVFSLLLVLVVLRTRDTETGAFAHGLSYTVAIFCGMNVFEGNTLINPASALGLMTGSSAFDDTTDESYVWLYLVGPFIGTLLAVVFYQLTEYLDSDDEEDIVLDDETTEYVKETAVTQPKQVQYKPEEVALEPAKNGYSDKQPVINGRYQQEGNVYPIASGNNYRYPQPVNGIKYSTEAGNPGAQNRYVQAQYTN